MAERYVGGRLATSHLEVEDKADVAPDAVLPVLDGLPQVASVETSEQRLEATYFDTTNLRLAAAGITVRRRTGGPDDGWHLKLPAGGARHEVTVGLGRGKATVPKRLRDTVRVFAGDEALGPGPAATHRAEHRLFDEVRAAARGRVRRPRHRRGGDPGDRMARVGGRAGRGR